METKQNFEFDQDTLFSQKGPFYWPSDFDEAQLFLEKVRNSKSKVALLELNYFSDDFLEKTKDWDFATTVN